MRKRNSSTTRFVDVEKGFAGEFGEGATGEGVFGGLLEVVVYVLCAYVSPPRLLPFPRALSLLPHLSLSLSLSSAQLFVRLFVATAAKEEAHREP